MPRKPTFSYQKTSSGWKVEIPRSMALSGTRERAFFKTRDKAREFAEELRQKHSKHGANHTAIKPSLAEAALLAESILEPTGASLVEAAKAFRKTWEARHASVAFGEAVATYLTQREDLRDATLKSYKYTLEKVMRIFSAKNMADITTPELQEVLNTKQPTARAMHLRNLKTFWRWASSPLRGWASMDAVAALEAPKPRTDSDIATLDADDVRALLASAEKEGSAAAAAFTIAVFAGVRMAELARLRWGAISEEHIEIGKEVAKKHSRRLIPVCPTLQAWLRATRGDAEDDDLIIPPDWDDVSKAVRRRAGWDVVARRLEERRKDGNLVELPKPTRGKWPQNACRHTCASVQVAIGTPLEDLTFKFGHSGGHDLLRAHYVSRLTRKDAIDILSIGPNGAKILNLNAA